MKENMFYGAGPLIFNRAEELRNDMTSSERIIWKHVHINEWRLEFRRQHPVASYIVDFYCHALKLVIEIDGDIPNLEEAKQNSQMREATLKSLGLTVLRFNSEEVCKQSDLMVQKIDETVRLLQNHPVENVATELLYVIKIGGNIIDDEAALSSFLKSFAGIEGKKIVVHGGGKLATRLAAQMNIPQLMVEGRRITDAETLKIVIMVYAGYINKTIVAQLQSNGCNAIGLSGADGNLIQAHKRVNHATDYGFAGDIDAVNAGMLQNLLANDHALVIAPITHDGKGQLLNTNADTIAQEIAKALSPHYEVHLIYSFEKEGVLLNANDDASVIKAIDVHYYKELKATGAIFAGMLPKLDNAFAALHSGVKKVVIGKGEKLSELINGSAGTSIVND